ncbi:MAG: hypothetical protein JXB07_14560 [Anaerolineae bacterium]|nr:hypothetical protein [Anaerolineae bacterium]
MKLPKPIILKETLEVCLYPIFISAYLSIISCARPFAPIAVFCLSVHDICFLLVDGCLAVYPSILSTIGLLDAQAFGDLKWRGATAGWYAMGLPGLSDVTMIA